MQAGAIHPGSTWLPRGISAPQSFNLAHLGKIFLQGILMIIITFTHLTHCAWVDMKI